MRIMRRSTNSGIHSGRVGKKRYPIEENLAFIADHGFEVLDINFCGTIHEGDERIDTTLHGDGWMRNVRRIGREAAKWGMEILVSHPPFFQFWNPAVEGREFKMEMVHRSLEASAMLGVRWAVLHPCRLPDAAEAERATREYVAPLLDRAGRLGVGLAIENMPQAEGFCADASALSRFVDGLGPGVGICWDTGHANITGLPQPEALRIVGKRLKCLHVHDNFGKGDDHRPPFMGNIDWRSVMGALKEIGYMGDLNFEVNATNLPESLRAVHAEYVVRTADVLIAAFEGTAS
jgi:sugar phosphate isomerase/epimerase